MTFIFVKCLRGLAMVTPVKYERHIILTNSLLINRKTQENNRMGKIGLVTSIAALPCDAMWQTLGFEIETKTRAVHSRASADH